MKQLLYSRIFPKTHPRAGEPTRFPEAIWAGLEQGSWPDGSYTLKEIAAGFDFDWDYFRNCPRPKYHTIRAGHRWKVGDKFVPRIWSGLPYRSPTITFGPILEVKKVWDILITINGIVFVDGRYFEEVETLAKNDGLTGDEFNEWFPADRYFDGQIICWNDKIEY